MAGAAKKRAFKAEAKEASDSQRASVNTYSSAASANADGPADSIRSVNPSTAAITLAYDNATLVAEASTRGEEVSVAEDAAATTVTGCAISDDFSGAFDDNSDSDGGIELPPTEVTQIFENAVTPVIAKASAADDEPKSISVGVADVQQIMHSLVMANSRLVTLPAQASGSSSTVVPATRGSFTRTRKHRERMSEYTEAKLEAFKKGRPISTLAQYEARPMYHGIPPGRWYPSQETRESSERYIRTW